MRCQVLLFAVITSGFAEAALAEDAKYPSHPPIRPLPTPSARPLAKGPAFFADPAKGNDANDGSLAKPWRTAAHGVTKLKPGDTLYLRGGTYREQIVVPVSGTLQKSITLRSYPGELAILDGGIADFYDSPEKAWEPCPGGVPGEFQSTKTYPDLGGAAGQTNVLGRFADSMVPLHGYRFIGDLRTANVYWNLKSNQDPDSNIYCGPGVFYDVTTGRLHVRLAHTNMKYLSPEENYRGETDPRKLKLIIAGRKQGSPLTLEGVRNIRVQDLVIRGTRLAAVEVTDCENIEFDGVTVYGGQSSFTVRDTAGLRLLHTACRGIAAPWTFRGSLKYRAFEARIFSASGWAPTGADSRDFELAYSEFTDSVDGVFLGNVKNVLFHHNLLDNVSDDGIFLTAGTGFDGVTHGGNAHIYQNHLSRCLTTFAFGVGHGRQKVTAPGVSQTGAGVYIYRNVFDYRRPVLYHQPGSAQAAQEVTSKGRFAGDHGGPAWEPMFIYHNTILADDAGYSYGALGLGDHMGRGAKRRVFNNIVVQMSGMPGAYFPPPTSDLQVDHNLFWSIGMGAAFKGDPFAKFRAKGFAESKQQYPPGWGAHDRFADAKFVSVSPDWKTPADLSLHKDSPAIDMGMTLPAAWPDPVRTLDRGEPDLGVVPLGADAWHIGVRGRLDMFGAAKPAAKLPELASMAFPTRPARPVFKGKPAAIVEGYPARDVPLVAFALRQRGVPVAIYERAWLDTQDYHKYGLIVICGSLPRAKIEHTTYTPEDLKRVHAFLGEGGTLMLMLTAKDVFRAPEGQKYFTELVGTRQPNKELVLQILDAKHPWLKHLKPDEPHLWLNASKALYELGLRADKGQRLIGVPDGYTTLYRVPVGKGQLIYVGWEIAASLPFTRDRPSSVDEERSFEEQMRILANIVEDLFTP